MMKQQRIDEMNQYRQQIKRRRDFCYVPIPVLLFFTLLADDLWWFWFSFMTMCAIGATMSLMKEGHVFAGLSRHRQAQLATQNVYRILGGWYVLIVGSVASYKLAAPWWTWILVLGMAVLLLLLYKRFNETIRSSDAAQPVRSELAMASGLT